MELDIYNTDVDGHVFLINAPKLVYFHVSQLFLAKYMTEDLSSLVEASVSVLGPDFDDFGVNEVLVATHHVDRALELLTKLRGVKSLSLDFKIMHVLQFVYGDWSTKIS